MDRDRSRTVYLKNPNGVTELAIRNLLMRCGTLTRTVLFPDHGYVEFEKSSEAESAVQAFQFKPLGLDLRIAPPRPPVTRAQIDAMTKEEDVYVKFAETVPLHSADFTKPSGPSDVDHCHRFDIEITENLACYRVSTKKDSRVILDCPTCPVCDRFVNLSCKGCNVSYCSKACHEKTCTARAHLVDHEVRK